ncbi:hypothetical protein TNCV_4546701 [Trichonephila clavipes]|nr:hypothetical protein TNCV_4546701 [Trichonephila clavipes]
MQISYHGRSNLLRIEAQHIQLLPRSPYSPDMSPIEHVVLAVGQRVARDPRLVTSKDELLLRIQANMEFSFTSRHSKYV